MAFNPNVPRQTMNFGTGSLSEELLTAADIIEEHDDEFEKTVEQKLNTPNLHDTMVEATDLDVEKWVKTQFFDEDLLNHRINKPSDPDKPNIINNIVKVENNEILDLDEEFYQYSFYEKVLEEHDRIEFSAEAFNDFMSGKSDLLILKMGGEIYQVKKDNVLGEGALGIVYEANPFTHKEGLTSKAIKLVDLKSQSKGLIAGQFYDAHLAHVAKDMNVSHALDVSGLAVVGRNENNTLSPTQSLIERTQDGYEYNDPEYFIMAMENHGEILEEKEMSLTSLSSVFNIAAETLNDLHKNGIVHRDLKPGNIMADGTIIDYNVSRPIVEDVPESYIRDNLAGDLVDQIFNTLDEAYTESGRELDFTFFDLLKDKLDKYDTFDDVLDAILVEYPDFDVKTFKKERMYKALSLYQKDPTRLYEAQLYLQNPSDARFVIAGTPLTMDPLLLAMHGDSMEFQFKYWATFDDPKQKINSPIDLLRPGAHNDVYGLAATELLSLTDALGLPELPLRLPVKPNSGVPIFNLDYHNTEVEKYKNIKKADGSPLFPKELYDALYIGDLDGGDFLGKKVQARRPNIMDFQNAMSESFKNLTVEDEVAIAKGIYEITGANLASEVEKLKESFAKAILKDTNKIRTSAITNSVKDIPKQIKEHENSPEKQYELYYEMYGEYRSYLRNLEESA